jgi:hypothetical protein
MEMYDYVVIKPVLSMKIGLYLRNQLYITTEITTRKMSLRLLVGEFFNTIPASYFSYHDGYFVLDLQPSILGSKNS